ncbi:MAG: Abi-alpha family protein [Panacagrimonas sp.]
MPRNDKPDVGRPDPATAERTAERGAAPVLPGDAAALFGMVASGALKLASRGPRKALDLAQRGITEGERLALTTLRKRMDAAAMEPDAAAADHRAPARPASRRAADANPVATVIASLLDESLAQTRETALAALHLRIAQRLLPDEARILAALSDGHGAALMHLCSGPWTGPAGRRWLENLSPVGREAGVQLAEQTPAYLTHLRSLGLLETGDEDKSLSIKYQLMEADSLVRKTWAEMEKHGLRPKFLRRTVRLSEAGRAFWAACQQRGQAGP